MYTKTAGNLSKIGAHTSNCCLKSGLKNNWMQKLDHVNHSALKHKRRTFLYSTMGELVCSGQLWARTALRQLLRSYNSDSEQPRFQDILMKNTLVQGLDFWVEF